MLSHGFGSLLMLGAFNSGGSLSRLGALFTDGSLLNDGALNEVGLRHRPVRRADEVDMPAVLDHVWLGRRCLEVVLVHDVMQMSEKELDRVPSSS